MLGKLIKYEFKATGRTMLPLIAAVLVLAALSGMSVILLDRETSYGILQAIFVLILIAFFACIFALGVMALVMMIERFYKNLLGSEGYLMFTLPVSVDALVWSKLIVSFIWFLVTAAVSVLAVLILMAISASHAFTIDEFSFIWQRICEIAGSIGAGNITGFVVEVIAALFLYSVSTCLHFYFAMAIGQSFANHKVMWSIIFYFVISVAVFALTGFAGTVANDIGIFDALNAAAESMRVRSDPIPIMHVLLTANAIIAALLSVLYYFPTAALLKKKLNLA